MTTRDDGDLVAVRRDDLLRCLQIATWRAGLLETSEEQRLKDALGIDEVPRLTAGGSFGR